MLLITIVILFRAHIVDTLEIANKYLYIDFIELELELEILAEQIDIDTAFRDFSQISTIHQNETSSQCLPQIFGTFRTVSLSPLELNNKAPNKCSAASL